ncbi:MAG: putative baseplate assembly protein [Gemmatimonadales bacterium]
MPSILELGPVCRDAQRRADILAHPVLNGIDFVEYERRVPPLQPHVLVVTFLKPLPDPPNSDPDGAYGLTLAQNLGLVLVVGGTRVVGIRPLQVTLVGGRLEIPVTEEGDFSDYILALGWSLQPDGTLHQDIPALDLRFSIAPVNFKAGCPVDFDCRRPEICPPERPVEPLIDYLAKDYASFRRQLLDLIPQLNPGWLERNPSDLGIALLELLAYEGDQLSYFQDAVANEAYLDTVRRRSSARKHARLVDYRMHDGRNAWAFVHLAVGSVGTVPMHTKLLSRITAPLRGGSAPPATVIPAAAVPDATLDGDPALAQVRVFETTFPLNVRPENNTILLHTWGDLECCLPTGTRIAYLYVLAAGGGGGGQRQASLPVLAPGDFVLLEEILGPTTGDSADADPLHRQVVQLEDVRPTSDPAYRDLLTSGARLQGFRAGDTPLPLLRVVWRRADALRFPLCLSARIPGQDPLLNVSVARGNIVLADHGRTIRLQSANGDFAPQLPVPPDKRYRFRLPRGPLTMQCQPDDVSYDPAAATLLTPRPDLTCGVREAKPAIALLIDFPTDPGQLWEPVPDLLDSSEFSRHFTVEVDDEGRPTIRFGDDEYGARPVGATAFTAVYRIGNGRAGNVGAEALAHAVQPTVAPLWPVVQFVRNPLAAQGGTDPESIEEVRQLAPAAFRAEQFRAVVEADYTAAAKRLPEVAGAVASFRWTGSWHTVFVGVDPRDPNDLITEPGGRTRLAPDLARRVGAFLTRYKLAGYDLEIRSGEYVPLDLAFELCVEPGYFRGDVVEAVREALSNRTNRDRSRGFFHPDNFTFGQAVYLSEIYAAIEGVQGVQAAFVTGFHRFGKADNGELATGVLPIGPWEIARLDNDPAFMENGVLRITAGGGK